jgi:hypothetical protein
MIYTSVERSKRLFSLANQIKENKMKYSKCKMKFAAGLLTVMLTSSMALNANAAISNKCKSGFVPAQKAMAGGEKTNSQVVSLLRFAITQCEINGGTQGRARTKNAKMAA